MFRLETIVHSRVRIQLLRLFLLEPSLELGVRETARRLGGNAMAVRNELVLLAELGILRCRKVANSTQYSADPQSEAAEPLRHLLRLSPDPSPPPSAPPARPPTSPSPPPRPSSASRSPDSSRAKRL